jgi:raffinose synthase
MVILENSQSGRPYVLLLPLLEGPVRASIQCGHEDNVDLYVESGSSEVARAPFRSIMHVYAVEDPFMLSRKVLKFREITSARCTP